MKIIFVISAYHVTLSQSYPNILVTWSCFKQHTDALTTLCTQLSWKYDQTHKKRHVVSHSVLFILFLGKPQNWESYILWSGENFLMKNALGKSLMTTVRTEVLVRPYNNMRSWSKSSWFLILINTCMWCWFSSL